MTTKIMKSSLKNNWVLLWNEDNTTNAVYDFDDYTYGESHAPSIGDEVESIEDCETGAIQYGIILGIIRSRTGKPVCYKVWRWTGKGRNKGEIDYIQASHITLCEPCGSAKWSLERIGYKLDEEDEDAIRFIHPETGDVIEW